MDLKNKQSLLLRNKKFLVTGGAGFIGSFLVGKLLNENVKEVIIYDNLSSGTRENIKDVLQDKRCKLVQADILDERRLNKVMRGAEGVFHLAAASLLRCYENPDLGFDVNIKGTFNVVMAVVKNNVKKIVFSSSASVYGNALKIPMTEDHPYNNETFYGATKIAGEHMLKSLSVQYGFDWVGLRYMNVYGPRQSSIGAYTSVIFKILDRINEGKKPIIFGDGSQRYDFIYVEDVAYANILAMKLTESGKFYNVGTGIGTSIKQLVKLILRISRSKTDIEYKPAGLTFVTERVGSTKSAEGELGFIYHTNLEAGIKKTILWRKKKELK